jgi:hypothetical protein
MSTVEANTATESLPAAFTEEQKKAIMNIVSPFRTKGCTFYCACPTCHETKTAQRKAEAETECPSTPAEETVNGVIWRKVPSVPTISVTLCGQVRKNSNGFLYRVRNIGRGRPGWVEVTIKNQRLFMHRLINETFYPERERDDPITLSMVAENIAENPNWGRPPASKKRKVEVAVTPPPSEDEQDSKTSTAEKPESSSHLEFLLAKHSQDALDAKKAWEAGYRL